MASLVPCKTWTCDFIITVPQMETDRFTTHPHHSSFFREPTIADDERKLLEHLDRGILKDMTNIDDAFY